MDDSLYWLGNGARRAIAYVETAWLDRIEATTLFRYELPTVTFVDLADAGMFVSSQPVSPCDMIEISHLDQQLELYGVELREAPDLRVVDADFRQTSLHVSSIRLRLVGAKPAG